MTILIRHRRPTVMHPAYPIAWRVRLFAARAAVIAAGSEVLVGSSARAYETAADLPALLVSPPVVHPSGHLELTLDARGYTQLPWLALEGGIVDAAAIWTSSSCTSLQLTFGGSVNGVAQGDGASSVVFIESGWTELGYEANAVAVTEVGYAVDSAAGTATITEADILLNAAYFRFVSGTAASGTAVVLSSVLAHEIGHAIGLAHPCEPAASGGIPACVQPAAPAPLMSWNYDAHQTATLTADDTAGLCFLYPAASCDPACGPGTSCDRGVCVPSCDGVVCELGKTCRAGFCEVSCSGYDCLATAACAIGADCMPAETCTRSLCLPSGGQIGDPCGDGSACVEGQCVNGRCARTCTDICPASYRCEGVAPVRFCYAQEGVGEFGASCGEAADCASELCVRHSESRDYCSRSCGTPQFLPCPVGFACETVGNIPVCVGPRADGSGCSVSTRDPSHGAPVWLMIVVGVVARRRR